MGKEKAIASRGRSSNFELLRIVAMLMIVVYHIVGHCMTVQMNGGNNSVPLSNTMYQFHFSTKKRCGSMN